MNSSTSLKNPVTGLSVIVFSLMLDTNYIFLIEKSISVLKVPI
ncbi:MAG: hypothetical protein QUS12_08280 [Methanosarcina sp.]|nr:hypothetical protein [Methanosarcina sp.]